MERMTVTEIGKKDNQHVELKVNEILITGEQV